MILVTPMAALCYVPVDRPSLLSFLVLFADSLGA
jgi:hypothetical protein